MLFRGPMGGGAASGKIGAMIAGHCAQGQYLKSRVKPTNPRSLLHLPPRNAIARLSVLWSSLLTPTQRDAWQTYAANTAWTNALGDAVHLSGQMEFIRSNAPRLQADQLYGDPIDFPLLGIIADAPTIFDRGDPGPTPALGAIPLNDFITMTYDNTADWVSTDSRNAMLVYAGIPKNSGVSFFGRRTRLAGIIHASDATGSFNFLNQWLPEIAYQQKWTAWWAIARADGRLTRAGQATPFDTGPPPPPIFLDAFAYPDGSLWGHGSWTDPGTGAQPIQVVSGTAFLLDDNIREATAVDVGIPADWSAPWSISIAFTFHAAGSDGQRLSIYPRRGDTGTSNIQLIQAPAGSPNTVAIAINTPGGNVLGSTAALPDDTPHVWNIAFDGTTITSDVNGLATTNNPHPIAGTANTLTLGANNAGDGNSFTLTQIRVQPY